MLTKEQASEKLQEMDKELQPTPVVESESSSIEPEQPAYVKPIPIEKLCQPLAPEDEFTGLIEKLYQLARTDPNPVILAPPKPLPVLNTKVHQIFLVRGEELPDYSSKDSLKSFDTDDNILFPCSGEKDSMEWLELIEKLKKHLSPENQTILAEALRSHFQALVNNKKKWAYPYLIAMDLYALLAARQVYEGLLNMQTFLALTLAKKKLKTGIIPLLECILEHFVEPFKSDEQFDCRPSISHNIDIDSAALFLNTKISKEIRQKTDKGILEPLEEIEIVEVEQLLKNCHSMFFFQLPRKSIPQLHIEPESRHSPAFA